MGLAQLRLGHEEEAELAFQKSMTLVAAITQNRILA